MQHLNKLYNAQKLKEKFLFLPCDSIPLVPLKWEKVRPPKSQDMQAYRNWRKSGENSKVGLFFGY